MIRKRMEKWDTRRGRAGAFVSISVLGCQGTGPRQWPTKSKLREPRQAVSKVKKKKEGRVEKTRLTQNFLILFLSFFD